MPKHIFFEGSVCDAHEKCTCLYPLTFWLCSWPIRINVDSSQKQFIVRYLGFALISFVITPQKSILLSESSLVSWCIIYILCGWIVWFFGILRTVLITNVDQPGILTILIYGLQSFQQLHLFSKYKGAQVRLLAFIYSILLNLFMI